MFKARSPIATGVCLADHPGRHTKPATNLLNAVRPGLQQLSIDRIDADRLWRDALLEHRRTTSVECARHLLHIVTKLFALFGLQDSIDFEGHGRQQAIFKRAIGSVIRRHRSAEHVRAVANGREPDAAVQAKSRNVQHAFALNFPAGAFFRSVPILNTAIAIELKVHAGRQQKIQRDDSPADPQDLGECISTEQHGGDHCLPELKGRHVFVRAGVDDVVNRKVASVTSAAIHLAAVDPKWKSSHRGRDDPHARPDR
ncbi:hypothetical protein D3C84_645610 [compost metagenome]